MQYTEANFINPIIIMLVALNFKFTTIINQCQVFCNIFLLITKYSKNSTNGIDIISLTLIPISLEDANIQVFNCS